MQLPRAIDTALDWTVVPGFSKLGYALRRGAWEDEPSVVAGRDVVVTGGSSGLGEAACEQLAASGARVHMVVRNVDKGEDVRSAISERTGGELRVWRCDLSDLDSIREFCAGFSEQVPELAALVHNAGAMPGERERSPQGFELTFATNVLGPFLMTGELLGVLRAGIPSRVVTVSSGGMYTAGLDVDDLQLEDRDYDPSRFYAHTKRCEVILSELWAERMAGSGIAFHSMHPGWAATPGLESSLPTFYKLTKPLLRSSAEGADTISWLVTAPEPGSSSGLFWHDRAPRSTHRTDKTRESSADRERLWSECERLTDWSLAGEREAPANGKGRG
ncbi:SDR family NAD(P)-dependent oxidoreductase [Thermoleophilia bacterium SCSIO 60948]|nr:SDR family NAD(P)-dependent oxidoreductase [Thermoleophilia bacterium SCSIO 60948]